MAYEYIPAGSSFGLTRRMLRRMFTELYAADIAGASLDLSGTLDVTGLTTLDAAATVGTTLDVTGVATAATLAASSATVLQDAAGDILIASGTTVPADTTTGYAKGCLFIDTDVATGTTGLNCNKGTNTSCVFTAVTQA